MKAFGLLASLLLLLTGCGDNETTTPTAESANGKAIYTQYCKLCHGADGQLGLNMAANLAQSELDKAGMVEVITHGRNTMQSYEGILTEAEIDAVADYVLTLRKQ